MTDFLILLRFKEEIVEVVEELNFHIFMICESVSLRIF
jgi:hypothetical protein